LALVVFLPAATAQLPRPQVRILVVSIPCWVFSPPRRRRSDHGAVCRVSIPCWVFSPPRLSTG